MVSVKSKFLIITSCILISAWLLIAQVSGLVMLLLPCLVCFLVLVVLSAVHGMAIPVFLYFLPFAPLLKVEQGTISFFTIALLAVYLIYIVLGSKNVSVYHLIPGLLVIGLTVAVKTVYGYSFDNSYFLFSVALLLVPFLSREIGGKYDFYWLTLFFVLGISIAAITARYLTVFPNIAHYIETFELQGAIRFAGCYGDPNFYSAHITAALGGVLIQLLSIPSKKKMIALIVMAAVLVYCGLMSVSKTFFLITVCLFILWLLAFLFSKGKISAKLAMVFVMIVGVGFLLSSTIFTEAIDAIVSRFGDDNNLSDFTTGRTDIWDSYIRAFAEDPLLLLFGKGYSKVLIEGNASHNTVIQGIFQFGLIGCVCLVAWIGCLVYSMLNKIYLKWNNAISVIILVLGAVGPWLALDLLFFDEFFLVPIYMCVGIRFLTEEKDLNAVKAEMS